jgi:hypothetical protein
VPVEVQAAIRSARMPGREVREFYRSRSYQPLWIRGGALGPEADTFLRLVESAGVEGLDPGDYRPGALADAIEAARAGPPAALARAEILLSRRFAQYVRDVRRPPRRPAMIYAERGLAPVRPTVRAVLEQAARAPSLGEHLETIGWMHPFTAGCATRLLPILELFGHLRSRSRRGRRCARDRPASECGCCAPGSGSTRTGRSTPKWRARFATSRARMGYRATLWRDRSPLQP